MLADAPMPATKAEINAYVRAQLDTQEEFRWSMADARLVWSAALRSDSIMGIGYMPIGFANFSERIHEIDVEQTAWREVRTALIDKIVAETNRLHPGSDYTAEDLLVDPRPSGFPAFEV